MTRSLTEEILKNASKARFHTPSHAGDLPFDVVKTDVTELPYTDNLHQPVSLLADLENTIASAFNAEACFISTQGATHNILQAVYATHTFGAFLVVGTAHTSVYNALRIVRAKAYHVDKFTLQTEIPSDVKNVIFTSPDYFGNCLPLDSFYPFLREKGLTVIVDSAHGSHFRFSSKLPVSASEYSDLAILSLHKTLSVLTGGSVLVCKKKYENDCFLSRKLFHSTSPNFAVLCSVEQAIKDYSLNGERYYTNVLAAISDFKKKLSSPFSVVENDDPTRLVLRSPYDGERLENELFGRGFVAEMSYEDKVVFIVNPSNYTLLPALVDAVNGIAGLPLYSARSFPKQAHPVPTPMEFGGEPELVSLSESEGRQVYCEIGFYPPGVPLLYSHDTITKEHIACLSDKNRTKHTFGLEKNKVFVVK